MGTSLKETINNNLKRNKARALCAGLAAIFAVGTAAVTPFLSNAEFYYYDTAAVYNDYFSSETEEVSEDRRGQQLANQCRDCVYSDLCSLGTVYLSNCDDGTYKGTGSLYESLYSTLSYFGESGGEYGIKNIFGLENLSGRGIDIDQSHYSITNIDSDYYYFYVSYGDECLTNIDGAEDLSQSGLEDALANAADCNYYYFRSGNKTKSVTPYSEKGLGKTEVYYSAADGSGGKELTSEYIDSDKLLIGAANKDSLGGYTFCFSKQGDTSVSSWGGSDDSYETLPDSVYYDEETESITAVWDWVYDEDDEYTDSLMQQVIEKDEPLYGKYISIFGGAYNIRTGSWISYEDLPTYSFEEIDTSKLTLFMSPKVDIVKAATEFADKNKRDMKIYGTMSVVFGALWGLSAAAFVVLSLIRPAEKYKNDERTFAARLFKPDLSAAALIAVCVVIFIILDNSNSYSYYIMATNRALIAAALAMLPLVLIAALSIDGIIRQFKIHGKSKPRLMINVVAEKTAPVRRRIGERVSRIPVIRTYRRWSLKARYRLWSLILLAPCVLFFGYELLYGGFADPVIVLIAAAFALLYLLYVRRIIKGVSALEKQIDGVLSEDGSAPKIKERSPIYPMSKKLSEISDKADRAVADKVKSEKMKVELVTNVSHDLKTPLTSIISYIDLLEKTELSDEARDYVKILSRKADKLRDIVADVFTLAKAVSGVEVELEELDLAVLTRQALADNADKISLSQRDIRTEIKTDEAPVTGDGAKLYRVIQNLLDNALKYSMEGTRIYLTLSEENGVYELSLKNVSAYEMKFTAEEITERFTRGDESRTDGGSGLGLSIAKTFTQACGGSFKIEIDGDIFKATVKFPKRVSQHDDGITEDDILQ